MGPREDFPEKTCLKGESQGQEGGEQAKGLCGVTGEKVREAEQKPHVPAGGRRECGMLGTNGPGRR